ncbi:hypothetical protein O3M35_007712 [Rhynocoris fuscipes]|uniref:Odorant receptor n=1 Tax=Rhynocoris fuscipes TaxID=488301 RepID=A0AAW1DB72_9HEMI
MKLIPNKGQKRIAQTIWTGAEIYFPAVPVRLKKLENVRQEISKDEDNKSILIEATNRGRKLVTVLGIFVISAPILSFVKTTIYDFLSNFENKRFFLQVWVPWSLEDVWPYIGTKIFVTLMAESAVLTNLAFADIHLTFACQMSAYLRILQRYFETKGPADRMIYQQHRVMIQLIQDYNRIFSGQMMLETLVSPLMPCGYGLTLTRALRRGEFNQLDIVQKIGGCVLPPFIVCRGAQEIITQVERLHEASYMSKWYEETPKVRKDLLMLMIRTNRPTVLNYRRFFTFDHQRLADVSTTKYKKPRSWYRKTLKAWSFSPDYKS